MFFNTQDRKIHFGLLFMRIGLAALLLLHALPKLLAGMNAWKSVGTTLAFINIGVPESFLGLTILALEALGGISLVFGYFFRVGCVILFIIFGLYAFNFFMIEYNTLTLWSLGLVAVFFGLIFTGPGRYAIAVKLEKK